MDLSETVSVQGTAQGVDRASLAADAFAARHRLPDALRRRMLTALDEVLSNIVRHGLRGNGRPIEVEMRCADHRLVMTVVDSAIPFNPLLTPVPDTTSPLGARRVGGLGIELVRRMTDDVKYERRDGRNRLQLTWQVEQTWEDPARAD